MLLIVIVIVIVILVFFSFSVFNSIFICFSFCFFFTLISCDKASDYLSDFTRLMSPSGYSVATSGCQRPFLSLSIHMYIYIYIVSLSLYTYIYIYIYTQIYNIHTPPRGPGPGLEPAALGLPDAAAR